MKPLVEQIDAFIHAELDALPTPELVEGVLTPALTSARIARLRNLCRFSQNLLSRSEDVVVDMEPLFGDKGELDGIQLWVRLRPAKDSVK